MDLNEIFVFVKVVESGSFVGAARILGIPKSTVSAKVSSLEARLGVTLIRRTTRRLFVTDVGQDYFKNCLQALSQISSAEDRVAEKQTVPQGLLRITAPVELGGTLLPEIITQFQKTYPEVRLELLLTDRTVDLVSEGVDLGIRAGELKDSSLIAKKLGAVHFAPFASPKYLKSEGVPKTPRDLKEHFCLQFTTLGAPEWRLTSSKGSQVVSVPRHLLANDLNLLKSLALSGVGIALLPTFFCYSEVRHEKLTRVLPEWKSNVTPVHFVYPNQEFVPKKLSAFLVTASDVIRSNLAKFSL